MNFVNFNVKIDEVVKHIEVFGCFFTLKILKGSG